APFLRGSALGKLAALRFFAATTLLGPLAFLGELLQRAAHALLVSAWSLGRVRYQRCCGHGRLDGGRSYLIDALANPWDPFGPLELEGRTRIDSQTTLRVDRPSRSETEPFIRPWSDAPGAGVAGEERGRAGPRADAADLSRWELRPLLVDDRQLDPRERHTRPRCGMVLLHERPAREHPRLLQPVDGRNLRTERVPKGDGSIRLPVARERAPDRRERHPHGRACSGKHAVLVIGEPDG